MEIHVGKKGEQLGPFTTYTLREQLESGVISGDDLGWARGMAKWIPLRDFEALRSIIEEVEKPAEPLEEEPSSPVRPTAARRAEIEANALRVNPFRRFFARMLDQALVSFATVVIFRPPIPIQHDGNWSEFWDEWAQFSASPEGTQFAMIGLTALLVWVPIEALFISIFGMTPGKAVCGLSVTGTDGNPPRWWTAFARSLAAWLIGCGAGIQWVSPPLMIFAFFQLLTRGSVFWDRYYGTTVSLKPSGPTRIVLAMLLFLSLIGLSHLATHP